MFEITITNLPDKINPISLVEEKMRTCPICNHVVKRTEGDSYTSDVLYTDEKGKNHKWIRSKNEFKWLRYNCVCSKCGTEWNTDYVPLDYKYFNVYVSNPFVDVIETELND